MPAPLHDLILLKMKFYRCLVVFPKSLEFCSAISSGSTTQLSWLVNPSAKGWTKIRHHLPPTKWRGVHCLELFEHLDGRNGKICANHPILASKRAWSPDLCAKGLGFARGYPVIRFAGGGVLANGCWTHREYDFYLMRNTVLDVDICLLHAVPFLSTVNSEWLLDIFWALFGVRPSQSPQTRL